MIVFVCKNNERLVKMKLIIINVNVGREELIIISINVGREEVFLLVLEY